ncbi:hypothetical protein niasHS_007508 [Heterodera schachtii]|uniref:Uncharacterized protein n=1 Tax=Heterodera schachtii TaxID=97005 RepID=A0ABD2JYC7_HETSC
MANYSSAIASVPPCRRPSLPLNFRFFVHLRSSGPSLPFSPNSNYCVSLIAFPNCFCSFSVPLWAWWTFALSLALVVIFLLLDWLLIRRNALSSSSVCFSFRRHPSGKYGGYSSASHCSGGAGMSGQDYFGIGTASGATNGGMGGGGGGAGGVGLFGHHKRSTNLILSV